MLRRLVQSEYLVLALCVLGFAVFAAVAPGFATAGNLGDILASMLPLLVVAIGQTLVLIVAGIDLSATAVIALASVTGAALITRGSWIPGGTGVVAVVGMISMIAVGGGVGFLNGKAVVACRIPPFIATLTSMMFFSGLAVWLTQSKPISGLPAEFLILGRSVGLAGLVTLGVAAGAHVLLTRTIWGRWMFAIGLNPKAAHISGVPVGRVLTLAYVLAGVCAGIAAVLITARLETGSPVHWQRKLLDVVGATVIGGTSLLGGRGRISWTVAGVLFLTLLDNGLNLLNQTHFAIMMVKGGVILLAAILDSLRVRAMRDAVNIVRDVESAAGRGDLGAERTTG